MSTDAADLLAVLPPDRRVGDIKVVGLETEPDVDSRGEDALVVTVTLAVPEGETWDTNDVYRLEMMLDRALVQAGEDRTVIFMLRPA